MEVRVGPVGWWVDGSLVPRAASWLHSVGFGDLGQSRLFIIGAMLSSIPSSPKPRDAACLSACVTSDVMSLTAWRFWSAGAVLCPERTYWIIAHTSWISAPVLL